MNKTYIHLFVKNTVCSACPFIWSNKKIKNQIQINETYIRFFVKSIRSALSVRSGPLKKRKKKINEQNLHLFICSNFHLFSLSIHSIQFQKKSFFFNFFLKKNF